MDFDTLRPERVWHYFQQLSGIPRCSGNEAAAMRMIERTALDLGLPARADRAGNLLVLKKASPGRESAPVTVVQSHVDMVCEKNRDSSHRFDTDPVRLKVEGEWVKAQETTLGADNGIGVAAMLALMEDSQLQAGPLELLFTVEEETGLYGASALEPDFLKGRMLINLDTEESGTIYIGCAGGRDSDISIPMTGEKTGDAQGRGGALRQAATDAGVRVAVAGLTGGHSGNEIHLGRANAIKLLARILTHVLRDFPVRASDVHGGDKHNAIPREAHADLVLQDSYMDGFLENVRRLALAYAAGYRETDPGMRITAERIDLPDRVFDAHSTANLIRTLDILPHGVIAMSTNMEGLVETSSNVSSVHTGEEASIIHASHRSSVQHKLDQVAAMHRAVAGAAGADLDQDEGYPAWTPDPESALLRVTAEAMRRVTGKEPEIRAIHAGLECGVIRDRLPGMDAVSLGPTIRGPHSPDERVRIPDVERFYQVVREVLSAIGDRTGIE
jgi:dipeptidase D